MASRLFSALCATAALSAPALAQDSIARCSLSFSSAGSANSVSVAAEVAEQTAVFVCDPEGPLPGGSITATATAVAEATATACAQAIASATVQCFAEGNSNFQVNGRSLASAEAFAFAQAYASALGTAEDCNRCQAAASFVGQQAELIWLEATARLEVRLAEAAQPGVPVAVAFNAFVSDFVDATASAFASVLVQAKVSAEAEGCSVDVEGDIVVDADTGDNTPPSSISCEVNTTGISTGFAQDVVANASASASVFACKNTTGVVANITASEFATATANAIAAIAADCTVSGGGFACVWANSSIATVVEACAAAFATAYADAVKTCKPECAVNATDVSVSLASIVVNATADAYLDQCAGPNSSFNITIIESELVSRTVVAVAQAIATAGIENGTCLATAEAITSITDVTSTMNSTTVVTNVTTKSPPVMKSPPPPPPVKMSPPPPPPVKVSPPPPPPVKVSPPPPPPVQKVVPVVKAPVKQVVAPVAKPPAPPVKKVDPPAKKAPIVTTKMTSTEQKTPTSTARTKTSTTVVIEDPEHIKPGTFVATSTSTAKAVVVESACAPQCVAKFHQCAGSGMAATATCCDTGFVCMKKNDNYSQCLPAATSHVYMDADWAKTMVTCKHY